MLGKKREQQASASQGLSIPFTGWCREGYWQNGHLLNRREFKDGYYRPCFDKPQTEQELRKSPHRESASRIAHRAIRKAQGLPEYEIPTLEQWRL